MALLPSRCLCLLHGLLLATHVYGQEEVAGGCSRPANPLNGVFVLEETKLLGSNATRALLRCNSGFGVRGRRESICAFRGWIPSLPTRCSRNENSGEVDSQGPGGRPQIGRLPLDRWVDVTRAGCLQFQCTVRGSPTPQVVWSVNGQRLDPRTSSDLQQQEDGSLVACNVQAASHVGIYRCDAHNSHGSAFRSISLTSEHPVWAQLAGRGTVKVPPRNGNNNGNQNHGDRNSNENEPSPRHDSPPRIRALPITQWAKVSSDCCVRVRCEVTGQPRPSITWTLNGQEIDTDSSSIYRREARGNLRICARNQRAYPGTYRCTARNAGGSAFRETLIGSQHAAWTRVEECKGRGPVGPVDPVQPTAGPPRQPEFPNLPPRETRRPPGGPGGGNGADTFLKRPIIAPKDVTQWATAVSSGCIVFSCSVLGSPAPDVSWRVDGRSVPRIRDYHAMPDGSLEVCNASPLSHSGTYHCYATNEYGTAQRIIVVSRKHPVWVELAALSQDRTVSATSVDGLAPTIDYSPLEEWVTSGASQCMDLRCRVAGSPPPTVTWTFQDHPVKVTGRYNLLTDGSLRACEVHSRNDSGRYRCDATNIYGSAWREVAVSRIHPVWEEVESDYQRPIGSDVSEPSPPNNRPLTRRPPPPRPTEVAPRPDQPENRPNLGDEREREFRPVIRPIADINNWVTRLLPLPRCCLKVWCEVTGSPTPNILWRKDRVPIEFGTDAFSDFSRLADGSLRVCNLHPGRHHGMYRCDASNTLGSAYRQVTIPRRHHIFDGCPAGRSTVPTVRPTQTVLPPATTETTEEGTTTAAPTAATTPVSTDANIPGQPPRLVKHSASGDYLVSLPNGCVKLVCEATGNPQPTITWKREGVLIDLLFSVDFNLYVDGLRICNFSPAEHSGEYECLAENEFGSAERLINVEFESPTAAPTAAATTAEPTVTVPVATTSDEGESPLLGNGTLVRITDDRCLHLECTATGNPLPLVSWRLDNGVIGYGDARDSGDFRVLESGSLKVCNVTADNVEEHVGLYVCDATNHRGTATRTFRIGHDNLVLQELLRLLAARLTTVPDGSSTTIVTVPTVTELPFDIATTHLELPASSAATETAPTQSTDSPFRNVLDENIRLTQENAQLETVLRELREAMVRASAQQTSMLGRLNIAETAQSELSARLNEANLELSTVTGDLQECRAVEAKIRDLFLNRTT